MDHEPSFQLFKILLHDGVMGLLSRAPESEESSISRSSAEATLDTQRKQPEILDRHHQ